MVNIDCPNVLGRDVGDVSVLVNGVVLVSHATARLRIHDRSLLIQRVIAEGSPGVVIMKAGET